MLSRPWSGWWNQSTKDKVKVTMGAMKIEKVKPDLLIHDDACYFEQHIKNPRRWGRFSNPFVTTSSMSSTGSTTNVPKKNDETRGKAVEVGLNQHVWGVQRLGAEEKTRIELNESIEPSFGGKKQFNFGMAISAYITRRSTTCTHKRRPWSRYARKNMRSKRAWK